MVPLSHRSPTPLKVKELQSDEDKAPYPWKERIVSKTDRNTQKRHLSPVGHDSKTIKNNIYNYLKTAQYETKPTSTQVTSIPCFYWENRCYSTFGHSSHLLPMNYFNFCSTPLFAHKTAHFRPQNRLFYEGKTISSLFRFQTPNLTLYKTLII